MKITAKEMQKTIMAAGTETKVTWSDIRSAVAEKGEVKNWLTEVRGPLQALINNGKLKRTADVHKEEYEKL